MKTICIYHSRDLDGWMSAAIVKKWFLENNEGKDQVPSIVNYKDKGNVCRAVNGIDLDMLGWDYGDSIPDLSEYDKVIMCDVSFPVDEMNNLEDRLMKNFIWIDHHISAINACKTTGVYGCKGIRDTEFAACELTWQYFFPKEKMPEIVRLLGRYDCFGHKFTKEEQDRLDTLIDCEYNDTGNTQVLPYQAELDELRKKKDEEQKVLEFQYCARAYMYDYESCYNIGLDKNVSVGIMLEKGEAIYKYLKTEAKQTYSKAFPIAFEFWAGGASDVLHYNFLTVNQERFNPINFDIDYHKEGYDGFACFWYKEGKWSFSLYNDNGEVDCSVIAKQYGGGGHAGASGWVSNTSEMIKIISK